MIVTDVPAPPEVGVKEVISGTVLVVVAVKDVAPRVTDPGPARRRPHP